MQLEAMSSHPIASYLGEETNIHFTTASFQVVVESDKVSLRAAVPWAPHSPSVSASSYLAVAEEATETYTSFIHKYTTNNSIGSYHQNLFMRTLIPRME